MSFKIGDEKIGTPSHTGGIISLAVSLIQIGGLWFRTQSLSRTISTDVTLVANTLYMVYAVLVGGVPQLRISTNLNSVGPTGFAAWKLVGAFYSDGLVSPSFGSFVNISGTPRTETPISFIQTGAWSGNIVYNAKWTRAANIFQASVVWVIQGGAPTPAATNQNLAINPAFPLDLAKFTSGAGPIRVATATLVDAGLREYLGGAFVSNTVVQVLAQNSGGGGSGNVFQDNPFTWGSGDEGRITYEYPTTAFNSTQLKDL